METTKVNIIPYESLTNVFFFSHLKGVERENVHKRTFKIILFINY